MIIQKLKNGNPVKLPDDSEFGGCMNFIFDIPVHVLDVGLLDVDERSAKVTMQILL